HRVGELRLERADRPDADIEPATERLDDALRPVEVAVLPAPSGTGERPRTEAGNELGRLVGRDEARGHPFGVLHGDVRAETRESGLRVRDEQIPAGAEAERHRRLEPLVRLGVERRRLAGEPARDRCDPWLAHASGLAPRRTPADAV